MNWTETVLVARRRSDGAFWLQGGGWDGTPSEWVTHPQHASPLRNPRALDAPEGIDFVELTITYEVADGSPTA